MKIFLKYPQKTDFFELSEEFPRDSKNEFDQISHGKQAIVVGVIAWSILYFGLGQCPFIISSKDM